MKILGFSLVEKKDGYSYFIRRIDGKLHWIYCGKSGKIQEDLAKKKIINYCKNKGLLIKDLEKEQQNFIRYQFVDMLDLFSLIEVWLLTRSVNCSTITNFILIFQKLLLKTHNNPEILIYEMKELAYICNKIKEQPDGISKIRGLREKLCTTAHRKNGTELIQDIIIYKENLLTYCSSVSEETKIVSVSSINENRIIDKNIILQILEMLYLLKIFGDYRKFRRFIQKILLKSNDENLAEIMNILVEIALAVNQLEQDLLSEDLLSKENVFKDLEKWIHRIVNRATACRIVLELKQLVDKISLTQLRKFYTILE